MNQEKTTTGPGDSTPATFPDGGLTPKASGAEEGKAQAQAGVFTAEVVYDYAYVRHSAQRLGCRNPAHDLLVRGAVEELAGRLGGGANGGGGSVREGVAAGADGKPRVICRRVWCVVAEPVNVHPADKERLRRRKRWMTDLGRRFGFTVLAVPVDWHGFRLREEDRRKSASEAERQWVPEDKGTDVTMAMHLLRRAEASDHPDGFIAVTGDADLAPALQRIRNLKSAVPVAVAGFSHSLSRAFYRGNPNGWEWCSDPILLDPHLAPLVREGKQAPAAGRTDVVGKDILRVEGRTMNPTNGDRNGARKGDRQEAAPKNHNADPDVGRIEAACPKRGELQVYRKIDGLMGAHCVLCIPLTFGLVAASLAQRQPFLEEAALNLGASRMQTWLMITLPSAKNAVLASLLLSFAVSFTEVVIVVFFTDTNVVTVSRKLWDGVRFEISPILAAASVFTIVIVVPTVVVFDMLATRAITMGRK